jgi:acetoacetate decarboxylase
VAKQSNRAKGVDALIATDPRENSSMAAYRYSNREHLIVIYHTDRAELVS